MKIIMLSGKAGSGKDTFYKLSLPGNFDCERFAFADYLKDVARSVGWDGTKEEKGRQLLIDLGSIVRKYNPNFWVDIVIENIKFTALDFLFDGVSIITDWRYQNEYDRMVEAFGSENVITVRIERTELHSTLTEDQQKDQSEVDLEDFPFDYVIENDTLEGFEKNIEILFKDLEGEQPLTVKSSKTA